jgi:spermidine synthase
MVNEQTTARASWAREDWPGVRVQYSLADTLADSRTPFQNMQIVQTRHYGRMLLLDGMVQTTEKDEFVYHEMMSHVPLLAHPCPRSVLIIGGGDGGILREVLRHPTVERAVLVEIDRRVIDFSREYLPMICRDSFDDPRAEIVITDGAAFCRESDETFDVIIVDSSDPIGPATTLFTEEFYRALAGRLSNPGIMTRQAGSTFMQPEELTRQHELAAPAFEYASAYAFNVPTYIGGLFVSLFCSHGVDPEAFDANRVLERFQPLKRVMRYYSPQVHAGALQLPPYVAERLTGKAAGDGRATGGPVTFGWEVQLDLYECDQQSISTAESIQRYARELCEVLDMEAYGPAQTPYFGEHSEHTKGYSLLQFIETSSITGHFSEATGAAYINVFSCKAYDCDLVESFSKEFFKARRVVARYTIRH